MKESKRCDICNSEEGKVRPVGNYVVELTKNTADGFTFNVCQGCYRKAIKRNNSISDKTKTPIKERISGAIRSIFGIIP